MKLKKVWFDKTKTQLTSNLLVVWSFHIVLREKPFLQNRINLCQSTNKLIHIPSIFHFYTPEKEVFWGFQEVYKWNAGVKWVQKSQISDAIITKVGANLDDDRGGGAIL